MSDYKSIFKTPDSQNWFKCVKAVFVAKKALRQFVTHEIKTFHDEIINTLPNKSVCTTCLTSNVIVCPTRTVCRVRQGRCEYHNGANKMKRTCEAHEHIFQAIEKETRLNVSSWKNTDATEWVSNAWSLAKCYMTPKDGYSHVSTAEETHFNGIVSVVTNCKRFDVARRKMKNIQKKVRSTIERMQDINEKISNETLATNLQTFIDLLEISRCSIKDSDIRHSILEMNEQGFTSTTEDMLSTLVDVGVEFDKKLFANMHGVDSQQLSELIESYVATTNVLIPLTPMAVSTGAEAVHVVKRKAVHQKGKLASENRGKKQTKLGQKLKHTEERKARMPGQQPRQSKKCTFSTENTDLLFQQKVFSTEAWPVLTFTCRHIDNVYDRLQEFLKDKLVLYDTDQKSVDKAIIDVVTDQVRLNIALTSTIRRHSIGTKILDGLDKLHKGNEEDEPWKNLPDVTELSRKAIPFLILICLENERDMINEACLQITKDGTNILLVLVSEDTSVKQTDLELSDSLSVMVCTTNTDTIFEDIDDLLERFTFSRIRPVTEALLFMVNNIYDRNNAHPSTTIQTGDPLQFFNHLHKVYGLKQSLHHTEQTKHFQIIEAHVLEINEFLTELEAIYFRSNVPQSERPSFIEKKQPNLTSEVALNVVGIPNVARVGDRFGTIEIAIDEDVSPEERVDAEKKVTQILKSGGFSNLSFKYQAKNIRLYKSCGAPVGQTIIGTLGCFAVIQNSQSPHMPHKSSTMKVQESTHTKKDVQLCALISKHVAEKQLSKELHFENEVFGHIIEPHIELDMAAARILDTFIDKCDKRFKTEEGDGIPKKCIPYDFSAEDKRQYLCGLNVYLRGAETPRGLGRISDPGNYSMTVTYPLLIIEDRFKDSTFSGPGDSGAIVCAQERRGKFLYAIAMLMGEIISKSASGGVSYAAVPLQTGIELLSHAHSKTFSFCDGNDMHETN